MVAAVTAAIGGGPLVAIPHSVQTAYKPMQVMVRMLPNAKAIRGLVRGDTGVGYLIYYIKSRGVRRPSLIVKLVHAHKSGTALAYVYQAPRSRDYISYSLIRGRLTLAKTEMPAIVMESGAGRWVIHGRPELDLTVRIYSTLRAMWEPPVNVASILADPGHRRLVYTIRTHAFANGVPEWDLRELDVHTPGIGLYRTNYAQREDDAPVRWSRSVSPEWPYVASSGHFLQGYTVETPPIVVNWKSGRIKDFSEVVSVRAEANGYALYSLIRLPVHTFSKPDFESPWGFYNLSAQQTDYPDLIVHVFRNYANDPNYKDDTTATLHAPLYPRPSEDIRYSWANHVGNLSFNYKVDMYGNVPYRQRTSLAGGLLSVDTPRYATYPDWAIGHRWPVTTFVDTEDSSYQTSEGIYDWPASSVGIPYVRGWTSSPSLSEFKSIRVGFRGEYRIGRTRRPYLYLSPIDGRLHLLYAEAGLWNLGNGLEVVERNLDRGPYIDYWKLVAHGGHAEQRFAYIGGWEFYSGPTGVDWLKHSLTQSTLQLLPPTDHRSWLFFRRVAAMQRPRSPYDMRAWLPHSARLVAGDRISGLTVRGHILGFLLDVSRTERGRKVVLPDIGALGVGAYWVTLDLAADIWHVGGVDAKPPKVQLVLRGGAISSVETHLCARIENDGHFTYRGKLRVEQSRTPIFSAPIVVPPLSSVNITVPWVPSQPGMTSLTAWLEHSLPARERVRVRGYVQERTAIVWHLTGSSVVDKTLIVLALMLSALGLFAVERGWWK